MTVHPQSETVPRSEPIPRSETTPLNENLRAAVLIPALDEEASVGTVVRSLPRHVCGLAIHEIVVVDNGSKDRTSEVAREAGATVVAATRRGYGSACLAGLDYLARRPGGPPDLIVFLDADGSDDPSDLLALVGPVVSGVADLVIGSRTLGRREPGALTLQQRVGNRLAVFLIRLLYGHSFTDLGPFRACRWSVFERLGMHDADYGWTVEMQVKAVKAGVRMVEVPVRYRQRIGRSKISGTLRGVIGASWKILTTIARESVARSVPIGSHPGGHSKLDDSKSGSGSAVEIEKEKNYELC